MRSEPLPDRSFQERHPNTNVPSFVSNLFKKKEVAPPQNVGPDPSIENYTGNFYSGKLRCPSCGNTGYTKCGNCGALTCYDGKAKKAKCAVCGEVSEIEGFIDNLDAGTDGGRGRSGTDSKGSGRSDTDWKGSGNSRGKSVN